MKFLSPDECGVPIIKALGIDGPVISLTLHCAAGEMPTIEVHTYVMADGRYVVDPVDPDKLQQALRRYRLEPLDDGRVREEPRP